MSLDFNDPSQLLEGLEKLHFLEWHERGRHGVIRNWNRLDDESQRLIIRALRLRLGNAHNIWHTKSKDAIEFVYATKQRGNKPWGWCNDTIVFKDWMYQEKKREYKARQFKPGDEVSFEDNNGDVIIGYVHSINKKSISVTVPGSPGWRVSPNLLEKVEE